MQMLLYEQVYLHTLSSPGVWLFTLVSLVAALLPDVVIRQIIFSPSTHPQPYLDHKLRGYCCRCDIQSVLLPGYVKLPGPEGCCAVTTVLSKKA